jgi:hypothetical protein
LATKKNTAFAANDNKLQKLVATLDVRITVSFKDGGEGGVEQGVRNKNLITGFSGFSLNQKKEWGVIYI